MRRGLLSFADRTAERAFLEEDDRSAVARARTCLLLALVMSLPFLAMDIALSRDGRPVVVALLLGGTGVLGAVAAVTTRWPRADRWIQLLVTGVIVVYGWGASATASITRATPDYAAFSSALLLLGLVGVARVRFRAALATALLTMPPALVVMTVSHPDRGPDLVLDLLCFAALTVLGLSIALVLERSRRSRFLAHRDLAAERRRSDRLLHDVLPADVVARLKRTPMPIADAYDEVTVLFADIVGFTPLSSVLPPDEVVRLLDLLFARFDDLCSAHGMEKIKTIGDAYMAVAGIPPQRDHAPRAVELAQDMLRAAEALSPAWPGSLALRIGISSGPVVAGVIGRRKFAFDLWGDAVNTASRMEAHGLPNRIHLSASTHRLLRGRYDLSGPHPTEVKGKGVVPTYFLRAGEEPRRDERHVGVSCSPSHAERRSALPWPDPTDCPP